LADRGFSNRQVWKERDIPSLGWIEAEPSGGENLCVSPANWIQTVDFAKNSISKLLEDAKGVHPKRDACENDGTGQSF
jgi:hypothetical protein